MWLLVNMNSSLLIFCLYSLPTSPAFHWPCNTALLVCIKTHLKDWGKKKQLHSLAYHFQAKLQSISPMPTVNCHIIYTGVSVCRGNKSSFRSSEEFSINTIFQSSWPMMWDLNMVGKYPTKAVAAQKLQRGPLPACWAQGSCFLGIQIQKVLMKPFGNLQTWTLEVSLV